MDYLSYLDNNYNNYFYNLNNNPLQGNNSNLVPHTVNNTLLSTPLWLQMNKGYNPMLDSHSQYFNTNISAQNTLPAIDPTSYIGGQKGRNVNLFAGLLNTIGSGATALAGYALQMSDLNPEGEAALREQGLNSIGNGLTMMSNTNPKAIRQYKTLQ